MADEVKREPVVEYQFTTKEELEKKDVGLPAEEAKKMTAEEAKAIGREVAREVVEEATLYQGFVQEVVTRKFQEKRGDPVGRSARVWVTTPKPGSKAQKAIFALGDPDVVQELGEALETEYDYHGVSPQPISKEREGEVVGEELGKLIEGAAKEAPHVLPRLGEALKGMGMLPGGLLGKLLEGGDKAAEGIEAALGLDEATAAFKKNFKKGGAQDELDIGTTEKPA